MNKSRETVRKDDVLIEQETMKAMTVRIRKMQTSIKVFRNI